MLTRIPANAAAPVRAGQALRLGAIHNPDSGARRRRGRRAPPANVLAYSARDPKEIGAALARLADQGVELLAVSGGDGTLQAVLTHLLAGGVFERLPLIALLPVGSTNMTAGDVGAVGGRQAAWQRLRDWARNPEPGAASLVSRSVLAIRAQPQAPVRCGMFFGAAMIEQAAVHTQTDLHKLGLRGAVGPAMAFLRFARAIAQADSRLVSPVTVGLRDDRGNDMTIAATLLCVSTLTRLLLGLRPFWGVEDGPIRWSAIEHGSPAFLRALPAICRGRGGAQPGNGYHSHNANCLELRFDGGYIVDGEFFRARADAGPVTITSAGPVTFLSL